MKALKKEVEIKVKSYMIKKVILSPRFIQLKGADTDENNKLFSGQNPNWLMWLAIQHPSLKPFFEEHIELDFWRILMTKQIPLGRSFKLSEFGIKRDDERADMPTCQRGDDEYKVNVHAITYGRFDQFDLIPLKSRRDEKHNDESSPSSVQSHRDGFQPN